MSKVSSIHPADKSRSSVGEEIDAMDWQFSELARLLSELEQASNAPCREGLIEEARGRLNKLVQRAFRAKQIARGLRVTKAS